MQVLISVVFLGLIATSYQNCVATHSSEETEERIYTIKTVEEHIADEDLLIMNSYNVLYSPIVKSELMDSSQNVLQNLPGKLLLSTEDYQNYSEEPECMRTGYYLAHEPFCTERTCYFIQPTCIPVGRYHYSPENSLLRFTCPEGTETGQQTASSLEDCHKIN